MALRDNKRLYDISTRLAVYVERVKVSQARQFNNVLQELDEEFRKLLGRTDYRNLDALSKAKLNKLIVELRDSQSKVYSAYTQRLISQLQKFMHFDLAVNRRVWVSAFKESEIGESEKPLSDEDSKEFLLGLYKGASGSATEDGKVWTQITNAPIPANGLYLVPFLKVFSTSAQAGVENLVRKAWANKWSFEQLMNELTNTQVSKIRNQATSVIHTAISHVAGIVSGNVQSVLFDYYVWVSVMDSHTTDICRGRNQKVYRLGKGPLPPAHIRCRSHTVPSKGNNDTIAETFYAWLTRQPDDIQIETVGKNGYEKLKAGTLKAADVSKYEVAEPLSFEEFAAKVEKILSR